MAKPNTKCRVCGKEYYCCADHSKLGGWKTMACCEDHYKEYMKRITKSRLVKNDSNIEDIVKEVETQKKRQYKMKPQFHSLDEVKEKEQSEDITFEE